MKPNAIREATQAQMQVKRAMTFGAITRAVERINKSQRRLKPDEKVFLERVRITKDTNEGATGRIRDRDWIRIRQAFENRNWVFLEALLKILKKPPRNPLKKSTVAEKFLDEKWLIVQGLTEEEALTKAQEWCLQKGFHPHSISADSLKKARQRSGYFKSNRRG